MKMSQEVNEVAFALSQLQSEISNVEKSKTVKTTQYSYSYAELGVILDETRPLWTKHGLAISQFPVSGEPYSSVDKEGITVWTQQVGVVTLVLHASGQFIESDPCMMIAEAERQNSLAQCAGKVITYQRRYSLAAVLNITQVDNDAQREAPLDDTVPVSDKKTPPATPQTPSEGRPSHIINKIDVDCLACNKNIPKGEGISIPPDKSESGKWESFHKDCVDGLPF